MADAKTVQYNNKVRCKLVVCTHLVGAALAFQHFRRKRYDLVVSNFNFNRFTLMRFVRVPAILSLLVFLIGHSSVCVNSQSKEGAVIPGTPAEIGRAHV